MKILICVDDSPHSKAAVEFARKMTWPKDSRAIVLSVAQPVAAVYAEAFAPAAFQKENLDAVMREHQEVASTVERTLQAGNLTTETRVLVGDARTAIVDTARDEGVDLVIVGSHGRTGLARLLLGSVASHVVAHAPCSVLVVKLSPR